jgi:hypothetical protein
MFKKFIAASAALALGLGTIGCDVDQTREGELPDVDVTAEPGQMPEYDVDGPEIDISSKEKQVTVPDVDISTKEADVTVPDVDIDLPNDDDDQ